MKRKWGEEKAKKRISEEKKGKKSKEQIMIREGRKGIREATAMDINDPSVWISDEFICRVNFTQVHKYNFILNESR